MYAYTPISRVLTQEFMKESVIAGHFSTQEEPVGKYAPVFSLGLWIILLLIGFFASWPFRFQLENIVMAALWWIVVFGLIGRKIDSYSEKLWFEISYLETSVILASKDKIQGVVSKIVEEMIKHPEYFEKGESYGMAFYKM